MTVAVLGLALGMLISAAGAVLPFAVRLPRLSFMAFRGDIFSTSRHQGTERHTLCVLCAMYGRIIFGVSPLMVVALFH